MKIRFAILFFFTILIIDANSQTVRSQFDIKADSILNKMTVDEKIGQLFLISAYSGKDTSQYQIIDTFIKKYNIGGVIFFKGSPTREVILTNRYQAESKFPLFIAMDAEWGVSMRLDSVLSLPKEMTLGAAHIDSLVYQTASIIADQCIRLGVHIDFAPVADINNNPKNPVISYRSFGENKENVTKNAVLFMKGLEDKKIMAVAKHFPGHGDTEIDSHKDLPILNFDRQRLDSLELAPFKKLISEKIGGVMVAHLHIPALDSATNITATLSKTITTGLLQNELGYKGLIFTDALNMKGVSKNFKPGEIELKAFLAGNDLLICSEKIPVAFEVLKTAFDSGVFSIDYLNEKVRKIIRAKLEYGVFDQCYISPVNVVRDLNTAGTQLLIKNTAKSAITIVKDEQGIIPLGSLDTMKVVCIDLGLKSSSVFTRNFMNSMKVDSFVLPYNFTQTDLDRIQDTIHNYNLVVICFHKLNSNNISHFEKTNQYIDLISVIRKSRPLILINFGNPYILGHFQTTDCMVEVYQDDEIFQEMTVKAIIGENPVKGKLPVTLSNTIRSGDGLQINRQTRLNFADPEEAGMDSRILQKIDTLVNQAISDKIIPGCQVLVARDSKIIFNKPYGYFDFDSSQKVVNSNLYDIASVTKVAATTLEIMWLNEHHLIDLSDSVSKYLPSTTGTDLGRITIRQLLLHEGGLTAWIPFYKSLPRDNWSDFPYYFSHTPDQQHPYQVSEHLFASSSVADTIWGMILKSTVKSPPKYVYSDLDFIVLKQICEAVTKVSFQNFLYDTFYKRLGMNSTLFNPLTRFNLSQIPPTEVDHYFRNDTIRGYVNDPAAALFGGISGHAGLFSNSYDLAILFQMLLNEGEYAGTRFLKSSTIEEFTSRQSSTSRRGLGFDKPESKDSGNGPTSIFASGSTFGHTGFTGTCVWADPEYNLIYIFLSNRTFPDPTTNKLAKSNLRTNIQDIIYKSVIRK